MTISTEKAEIIGLLCADGSHFVCYSEYMEWHNIRKKRYFKRRRTERIEFTNKNNGLLIHFRNLVLKVYGEAPKIKFRFFKVRLIKKKFIYDLLRFTDFSCEKWSTPKEIIKGSNDVKAAFIRGVYEGDGTKLQWRRKVPYLEFHMYNIKGLKQIKKLLLSLGIHSKLYPYPKLIIKGQKDVIRFAKLINLKFKKIDIKSIISRGRQG